MVVKEMKQFQVLNLVILVLLTTSFTEALSYAKRGCKDMCGEVSIPYPFGIGANCSINEWYNVDCSHSTPYLSAFNNMEVLWVNLQLQMVVINVPMIADRHNPVLNSSTILNTNHGDSPFLFCKLHNKLVVEGCGNVVITHDGPIVNGCSSTCRNDTVGDINKCFGTGCCQTTIPYYLESFTLNLACLESQGGYEVCRSALLMDDSLVIGKNFSLRSIPGNGASVPIGFLWTLADRDYHELNGCSVFDKSLSLNVGKDTRVESHKCECGVGRYGNPYLEGGCEVPENCKGCEVIGGRCIYQITYMDGNEYTAFNCLTGRIGGSNKISVGVILGVSISMGVLFLTTIIYALYKVIKKTKARRCRKRFFKRNGGLLLKQQEEADPSLVDKTILFTSRELEKATDHYNENRILGRGGQGTVYKGMLVDGRIVAVKKSKVVDESQLEQFVNEVVILSQVNHRNVVKLLGCCLETEVPLLVSEFISNGTLYDRIHNGIDDSPISFKMRLQIATEVAGALAYLHSATSIPIYHRDIKTTNILLDEKYRAKVSDFGTSRFVSIDQTHLTTLVKGTFGYLDPEYFQSSQFTEKSDVYSFGVVLVELLTGERPISLTRFGGTRSLATHFLLAMEDGRVMSIFDSMVIKGGSRDELLAVANLAMRCLNLNGKNRPTMKEVAVELESIRMSHIPSTVQTSFEQVMYPQELEMTTYGESTSSTFLSVDNLN